MEFVQPIRDRKKINDLKAVLKGESLRNYVLFTIGINSGLRISDLLLLKRSDVLNEKGQVKERITLREKKTGKEKDFPVGKTSMKALNEYLHGCVPDATPLFPSRKGSDQPITRQQAYRILNKAARSVGIKDKIGTHTLRKSFGFHAFKSGVDITRLQKLFNHSAPIVTLAYIGITQDDLDKVYLNLEL